ncbi:MAG TPA: bifunctional diaminohydroxyphosphoribosylaminopyrimidine deaminase/5-amino-6-(5-phosphoribosylamino)uracil reductase RibD [Chloroflexota bacterium]
MRRALALARRALPSAHPNPAVGAVVVHHGEIVGQGFTQPPGQAHAEIVALARAGERARGATLYVTLEPCCHHGRTPPCVDAIVAAGVSEVRLATIDPSPWVNGEGVRRLEAAGVRTVVGEGAAEARRLNEAYFKYVSSGLPFVTAKYAMTADGKIATSHGRSRWISGAAAREVVARLRAEHDAVLVGVETVLRDDPQLTARPGGRLGRRQPLRVVVDSRLRLPLDARLVSGGLPGATLVLTTELAPPERRVELERRGVQVAVVPSRGERVDLRAAMMELARREVVSVLVEAGGTLLAALLAEGLVDKVVAFVAPKLFGGTDALTPVEGAGIEDPLEALELVDPVWRRVGRDIMLEGYVEGCSPAS